MSKFFETFTPETEKGKAEKDRRSYSIKPLSKMDFWEFLGSADQKGKAAIEVELKVLAGGVTNWQGYSVPFEANRETILKHIPVIHARSLVKRIVELSVLSDAEVKN